jgi:hypothetical protein
LKTLNATCPDGACAAVGTADEITATSNNARRADGLTDKRNTVDLLV